MKTNKTSIFLACITVLNLVLLLLSFNNRKGNIQDTKLNFMQKKDDIARKVMGLDQSSWVDENNTINNIGEIKSAETPLLALRFSFRNCDVCTKDIFDKLELMCDSIGFNNQQISLLGTFYNNRDTILFKSRRALPYKLIVLPENSLGLHLEQDDSYPFFFVLFPDGSARHIFIPIREDVQRTRTYLSIIYQKYFKYEN